jgi:hypothetical protein
MKDVTLVGENGVMVAHRIDCPEARRLIDVEGAFAITMLEISRPLPPDVKRHSCIEDK